MREKREITYLDTHCSGEEEEGSTVCELTVGSLIICFGRTPYISIRKEGER